MEGKMGDYESAYDTIQRQHKEIATLRTQLADLQREHERLREGLLYYGEHKYECPIRQVEGGGPTPEGGYRWKVRGKWYPDPLICACGLNELLNKEEEK